MSRVLLLFMIMVTVLAGCMSLDKAATGSKQPQKVKNEPQRATAKLIDQTGKSVGTASFEEVQNGVKMELAVTNIAPGQHGLHIHEVGKCTLPDFQSAKKHFNPTHKEHGEKNPKGKHMGDMLNLTVDSTGKANASLVLAGVTLQKGQAHSLFHFGGTSIVIHEKIDDYKTDPSGDSGKRIACGVIQ
ncbi:superoxide dismutase, Cu-Zn family [Seinonella peptonophila]|uniref:Superoxide dismutase [Cu-Zn] n=1 Tax=Seinonella peptonophila TaxID=112248 RepID=A0A1M4Z6R8_9BACL|nr:superoxide dismutase family protein [Seinonella peptonophila]SHF13700.1 superoxide dismutase, Cu-Zn family [Seinonella peptonophila]